MSKRGRAPALDEIIFAIVAPIAALVVGIPLGIVFLFVTLITLLVWAAIAAVTGLGVGLRNFVRIVISAHRKAASTRRAPRLTFISRFYEPQPARQIYMYDAGWFVIEYVFQHIGKITRRAARVWFHKARAYSGIARGMRSGFWDRVLSVWMAGSAGGMYLGGAFHFVAAFLITGLFGVIHALVMLGGMAVTSLFMLLLGLFNSLQGTLYRIYSRCPNCHAQMRIPIYVCPQCGRQHTRLWPSIYGVLTHTCDCGERLPTLDILGRRKLTQRCPSCDAVLNEAIGRATNIHIPIVGGPSAGKTHFIIATIRELIERYAPAHNITITMPDVQHRRDYEAAARLLRRGQQLRKTQVEQNSNTRAYNLQIKRRWHPVPTLLYIYDGAGEYYTNQESAQQQVYYRYVNGFIMVVDPFAIERVYAFYRDRLEDEGQTLAVNALEPLSGIYERMIEALEIHYNLKRDTRFPHPIAVVLTKVDAFDLAEQIGAPAARRAIALDPTLQSEADAIHRLTQHFLEENGEGNFVRNLQTQFGAVRFFTCSSTGRMVDPADYSSFEPVRVLESLLWIMAQNNVLPEEPPSRGNMSLNESAMPAEAEARIPTAR